VTEVSLSYPDTATLSSAPRLRLRVFHTAVRYGKRHVKLIETSAEERDTARCLWVTVTGVKYRNLCYFF
jgi:hypothetical protein